jgi:hypothetical protein
MLKQQKVAPARQLEAVLRETSALAAVDVSALDEAALLGHLERLNGPWGRADELDEIIAAIAVGMSATNATMQLCRAWLGDVDGSRASGLLSALGGLDTAESGLSLWRLGDASSAAHLPLSSWRELEPTGTIGCVRMGIMHAPSSTSPSPGGVRPPTWCSPSCASGAAPRA